MASESTNGGLHGEVKTITIRTFSNYDRADIARSDLEAHGIECWVNADDCGGMYESFFNPISTNNPDSFRLLSPSSK
jgi:hypothetical protein